MIDLARLLIAIPLGAAALVLAGAAFLLMLATTLLADATEVALGKRPTHLRSFLADLWQ